MSVVNVITISQKIEGQKKEIVKLRLLEKWHLPQLSPDPRPEPNPEWPRRVGHAAGTWVVEGSEGPGKDCFASGPFPSLDNDNRTWNYIPTLATGLLTIGHSIGPNKPFEVHGDAEGVVRSLSLDRNTYVALFGIRRIPSGKFQAISDETPSGVIYPQPPTPPGVRDTRPPTAVIWESEWGNGLYPCPAIKWVWDQPKRP